MSYLDFLRAKIDIAPETGLKLESGEVNPALLPHQRDGVLWAVRGGRRALFEAFGLGKTVQELEFCRLVLKRQGGRALIVMPLEVRREFVHDAVELLGMEPPRYIRRMEEAGDSGIYLTNYERVRDGDIDPRQFTATSLDEASVLRSFGSKTYQTFLEKFKSVPFKLVATATPAPNKYKELIHYAGYLEVMDTGQALTRFFKRDSTKANNLTLFEGKEREFWLGCPEYILLFRKLPSDTSNGFADEPVVKAKSDYSLARWQVDAAGFWRSSGNRRALPEELASLPMEKISRWYKEQARKEVYDYRRHLELSESLMRGGKLSKTFETVPAQSWTAWVWDDITRMRTLNSAQKKRRRQMHLCPLQLDIVERVIERYSSPGDLVLDPFGGLMTVPETAVKMGRYGYGIELNPDYFKDGVEYCRSAEAQVEQPTLFDLLEAAAGEEADHEQDAG